MRECFPETGIFLLSAGRIDGAGHRKGRQNLFLLKDGEQILVTSTFPVVSCHILVSGHILVFLLLIPETND